MTEDPDEKAAWPVDELIVRRWLTALGLLSNAEEMAARRTSTTSALALIAADTACEAVLAVIASWGSPPEKERASFWEYLSTASVVAEAHGGRLERSLVSTLRSVHQVRDTVVHHGAVPADIDVDRALRAGRRLLGSMSALSPIFTAMPAGTGVGHGVASLIDAPEVADQLRLAERQLSSGSISEALDAAARALDGAITRCRPSLREGPRFLTQSERNDRDLQAAFDHTRSRLAILERWVFSMALGLLPAEYERLLSIIGERIRYVSGNDRIHRQQATPTAEDAHWAVGLVAQIVFHLWESRTLVEGDLNEVFRATRSY